MTDTTLDVNVILDFASSINVKDNVYPEVNVDIIDRVLNDIAKSGFTSLDWKTCVMPFIAMKINQEFRIFYEKYGFTGHPHESFEDRKAEIFCILQSHEYAPFTVQRLVELIQTPDACYTSTRKFMNGVLKLLSVTSSL